MYAPQSVYSPPNASKNRMHTDVMKLIKGDHEVEQVDGLRDFHVKFNGPAGSLYEGGVWKVRVHLPEHYPFKSPSLGFVNVIYHPNVDERSGSICLDVLNEVWSPSYDLSNIFESFLPMLLTDPNPNDALNLNAANLYLENREKYESTVKYYVQKYASREDLLGLANLAAKIAENEAQKSDSESSMSSDGDEDTKAM